MPEELQNPFIIGELCYLRGLTEADLEGPWFQWMNDYEVTHTLESGKVPNSAKRLRDYFESTQESSDTVHFAICDKATNTHIGNIGLRDMHPIHHRANIGILIGDKRFWSKGYGTEAVSLVVDYGFRRWNLHSIWLGVLASNKAAVRAYEKVGFILDGTEREACWADGRFHDLYHMSILAREHFARLEKQAPEK
jgi:[ribosomal protein S5]-alanine N-acetyltransferase